MHRTTTIARLTTARATEGPPASTTTGHTADSTLVPATP